MTDGFPRTPILETKTCLCFRCHKSWTPRSLNPVYCPRCKSPLWNAPKKEIGTRAITATLVDSILQKYAKWIAFPAVIYRKTFIFFTMSDSSKHFVLEVNPRVEYTNEEKKMHGQFRIMLGHLEIPVVQHREKTKEEEE